jgi:hypothetical protein
VTNTRLIIRWLNIVRSFFFHFWSLLGANESFFPGKKSGACSDLSENVVTSVFGPIILLVRNMCGVIPSIMENHIFSDVE